MMRQRFAVVVVFFVLLSGCAVTSDLQISSGPESSRDNVLVIAHRGASGYLPEHTIAAKAMAYAQGADYIEQDLVMTRDDHLVVLHDRFLDTVTNVKELFPARARSDGRYYVIDFNLDEIRQLQVSERFEDSNGVISPVFADRFPVGLSTFRVHTFAEEIELLQGLNKSTGRSVGIYPEIKSPAFHRDEGKDISTATLEVLKQYGYVSKSDAVFLQCFDADELRRIHGELLPEMSMDIRLVQLMGTSREYDWMLDNGGMQQVSAYADSIGPSILLLIDPNSTGDDVKATKLVEYAHAAGMQVHPYTFRRERDQMPPFCKDFDDFLRLFIDVVGVDGVFTDYPDLTVDFIESGR
jgi:glycerophosphoryl diester phosphodiesterase